MTVAMGIDIQNVDEVTDSLESFGDRYLTRLYTERELEDCELFRESLAKTLAARFAAKEAVLKALEPSDNIPPWRSIEVLLGARRCPLVHLSGAAQELAQQRGVDNVHLSIAFGRDFAVAAVVADVVQNSARTHST